MGYSMQLYCIFYTLYSMQLYCILYTLYSIYSSTVYCILCTLYTALLYIVYSVLYIQLYCIFYTVPYIQLYCIFYTVLYTARRFYHSHSAISLFCLLNRQQCSVSSHPSSISAISIFHTQLFFYHLTGGILYKHAL